MGVAQSVGDAVSERMRANQAEGMEKQRQAMLVMQMAMVRERTWWIGGVTALLATALTAAALRGKSVALGLAPLTLLGTVTAYHWDMGYGTKVNRIRDMQQHILSDERYWFVAEKKN